MQKEQETCQDEFGHRYNDMRQKRFGKKNAKHEGVQNDKWYADAQNGISSIWK